MSKQDKSTFCALPWMQVATNASGFFRVCCNSTPGKNLIRKPDGTPFKLYEDTVDDMWNSSTYTTIREQMLSGVRPEMCSKCFGEEDVGIRSSRIFWNERWEDPNREYKTQAELDIKYLDIRLGNLCNLKCRMCNPYASNQWVDEWELVHPESDPKEIIPLKKLEWMDNPQVWDSLNSIVDSVEEIYFTGGEPTIIKEQHRLLDYCIDNGVAEKIILKYNTNLTNIPKHLLDKWSKFKLVKLNCSIDAYGDLNRYIRYPSDWSMIEKNFRIVKSMPNVKVEIHCAVQMYNILHMSKLIDWANSNRTRLFLNILDKPEFLNIKVLPEHLKEKVALQLSRYTDERIQGMVDYMLSEDWNHLYPRFLEYTHTLDKSRGESIEILNADISK